MEESEHIVFWCFDGFQLSSDFVEQVLMVMIQCCIPPRCHGVDDEKYMIMMMIMMSRCFNITFHHDPLLRH